MFSKFSFTKNLNKCLIACAAVLLVGLVLLFVFGVKPGVGFTGSNLLSYSYTGDADLTTAKDTVKKVVDCDVVIAGGSSADGKIGYINVTLETEEVTAEQKEAVTKALTEQFKDNEVKFVTARAIAPTITTKSVVFTAAVAVVAAAVAVGYIAYRFNAVGGVYVAVASVVAFVYDSLIALVVLTVCGFKFDAYFAAVVFMLLVNALGNAHAIFGRIRENKSTLHHNTPVAELVDLSARETITRNLLVTVTTLSAAIAMIVAGAVLGATEMTGFAVAMVAGLVSGFFTSTFVAAPLWAKCYELVCAKKSAKAPKKNYAKKKR